MNYHRLGLAGVWLVCGAGLWGAEVGPPAPLPDHPGNIHVLGEAVRVRRPDRFPTEAERWRVLDEKGAVLRTGAMPGDGGDLRLEGLGVGWYRVEFGTAERPDLAWTTAAVLGRLRARVPEDSPVAVDSATAWFARNDLEHQRRLANLAALAGVSWVRDRLRWADVQPADGALVSEATTYDLSADVQRAAGLNILQVFHDTPAWAREGGGGGRFPPDLRRGYDLCRALAQRFQGRVAAWEPWNEANVSTFGGHTVDQMCSWQKATWLGFKAGDPNVTVGWNVTTTVPTPAQTEGVLANETWPYYDTYNIHTYDLSHGYAKAWAPAREAAAGRPIWVTEADRGTPHLKNPPWYDQEPRLERLKAEWIPQAYASSLYAGAARHFHFILGHYHEPNAVQFGLLRLDMTPRPAYCALAAVGRCLAGARALGRWQPGGDGWVYAFRARPDGEERDVLVAWAEKEADWDGRGKATAPWKLPDGVHVQAVVDYLGRSRDPAVPALLSSAPVFVVLPAGEASRLPLEPPPSPSVRRPGTPSPVVLQVAVPGKAEVRVEDLPWSEGYAYRVGADRSLAFDVHVYNFGAGPARGTLGVRRQPGGWKTVLESPGFSVEPMGRQTVRGRLDVAADSTVGDGWVVLGSDDGGQDGPVIAFRVLVRP
ncbi:MAG TPA: hypothetical protein PKM73_06625 [Verrucomicrobiota bacterium]|nr:hypothetical protein [Verrucomicrobiota bacterium]HNU50949.1 hypothetical protein [Verrucomicrobiota bacterium]